MLVSCFCRWLCWRPLQPHRGVIATQTISMVLAFILAGLTLSHHIREWSLIAILFSGNVNAFDVPIRQAFFVEMVGKEDLPNAMR